MPSVWIGLASIAAVVLINSVAIAFWAGRISQRMTHVENGLGERVALNDKVTEMATEQKHANKALDKLGREMEGVHRQLANIATGRLGLSGELPPHGG